MTPVSLFLDMIPTFRVILFQDSPILLLQANSSPNMIPTFQVKVNMFRGKRTPTLRGNSFQSKILSRQFSSLKKILIVAGQALSLGGKKATNSVGKKAVSLHDKKAFLVLKMRPMMSRVVQSQGYLLQSSKNQREVRKKKILLQPKKDHKIQGLEYFQQLKKKTARRARQAQSRGHPLQLMKSTGQRVQSLGHPLSLKKSTGQRAQSLGCILISRKIQPVK